MTLEPSKKVPLVSVVILNWNRLEDTKVCIEYVKKLKYPKIEIILVDNGSVDGSKEYFSKHTDGIIYIDNRINRGFTGGHIDGFRRCSGKFIVLLNNDAVIKSDYISRALEQFEDPTVGIVGGRAYWWNQDSPLLNGNNPYYSYQEIDINSGDARMFDFDRGAPQVVNNVSGACMVVRRSMINKIGYLYDRFFAYFEETDLCARAKRAGYKVVYDPSLCIWHRNGASSGSSSGSYFFYYQMFRNRFIFATRNFERKYLVKMWLNYISDSREAFKRLYLKHDKQLIDRAFLNASLSNLVHLLPILYTRHLLTHQLGETNYNHTIYSEQLGISVILDLTNVSREKIESLAANISQDRNPLHEYVLITRFGIKKESLTPSIKICVCRSDNSLHNLRAGYDKASFPWVVLSHTYQLPPITDCHQAIVDALDTSAEVIVFSHDSSSRKDFLLVHKPFLDFTGGLNLEKTLDFNMNQIIEHGQFLSTIFVKTTADSSSSVPFVRLSPKRSAQLAESVDFGNTWPPRAKPKYFERLQSRHHNLWQIITILRWLSRPNLTLRLKLARIKNLLLFSILGRRSDLSGELTHIRNESNSVISRSH